MQKTTFSCPVRELSCIIGNLFAELEPPCESNSDEHLVIRGTTFSGNAGILMLCESYFTFCGEPTDIETIRSSKCLKGCNNGGK